ncbi:tetratricopeptide repeat protein [Ktedonospora formicarum]|uniref:CpXC domain-containing protein n=1 Tax=Ktedonospora formicarum TaxID=2778364 RepID=A0A8J3MYJ5_9CHLR|nr:tetratricopeptide repeat protein [Ktedonospora formicarum]GHO50878.1 hypothetical protein KSX_90410 [Ktedonospora formicarum]
MKTKMDLTCPNCNASFEADYSPQIDAVAFPNLVQSVIAGTLNMFACPKCGRRFFQKVPCVYWHENWVGVVLEMGSQISAEDAIRRSNHLLYITQPERRNLPSEARILGNWDDLVTLLQNPQSGAYAQQLADLAFRSWVEETTILVSISDAFLKAEMPEYAFWVYAFMINYIPDLYFNSAVQEILAITALEAGNKLLPLSNNGQSVEQELERIEQRAGSLIPNVDRSERYNLVWYIPVPPDSDGLIELKTSIIDKPVSPFEQALGRFLTIFLIFQAQKLLPSEDEEIESFRPLITQLFLQSWEKISRKEQLDLEKLSKQLVGSSLINDSKLPLKDERNTGMPAQKTSEQWRDEGDTLRELHRYEEALFAYEQAIRLDSDDVDAYINKGNIFGRLQQYEEALAAYTQAVRVDPNSALAYYNQGYALHLCGRYKEALVSYDHAIRLDPSDTGFLINKGSALSDLQLHKEALATYEQAISIDPNCISAYYNKGQTLGTLERYQEAVIAFDQVIRLDPYMQAAYRQKGGALSQLQHYKEALSAYEQAVYLDSKDFAAVTMKGFTLWTLGRRKEALVAFEAALRLNSNDASLHQAKGTLLEELGRSREARQAYTLARKLGYHE